MSLQIAVIQPIYCHCELENSLAELVAAEAGTALYGPAREKLRTVFLRNLQKETCGNDGFQAKVEGYNKNSGKAALLTKLIVYLLDIVALPMITPAIANIAVLWVLRLDLRTFSDYTDPQEVKKHCPML